MARVARYLAAASFLLLSGCGAEPADGTILDPETAILPQGTLQLPTTVWEQNPRADLQGDVAHGYVLSMRSRSTVTVRVRAAACGHPDPVLTLFDGGAGFDGGVAGDLREPVAQSDDSPEADCRTDAVLHTTLHGDYLLVVSKATFAGGAYRLDVTCDVGCQGSGYTLAHTRIDRQEIIEEAGTPELNAKLDQAGDFLFRHVFRVSDGLGNGLLGAPAGELDTPNMRRVHNGAFGGPDAQSCVSCHTQGGIYGAGGRSQNIFQAGNGTNPGEALERNPPSLRGAGYRQAIGAGITKDLEQRLDEAQKEALSSGQLVDLELCVGGAAGKEKGQPCFGHVVVFPYGRPDKSGLDGIDSDLVVKPFGLKGREASIYKFVLGGFRVHFGMQAADPIDDYCDAEPEDFKDKLNQFEAVWGNPAPDCRDPDRDGVREEITFGQLSGMAVHLGQLPPPVGAWQDPKLAGQSPGEQIFEQIGCVNCHVRSIDVPSAKLVDGPNGELEAPLFGELASLAVWSDFKRHDMGDLRDPKDFDNAGTPIAAGRFITPPLWDLALSAPYLHDGRAATLEEAILAHEGSPEPEAIASVAAFRKLDDTPAQKEDLMEFLLGLGIDHQD